MSAVYLIRHGRTEANDRHLYCGSTDLPLSESGRQALGELPYHLPPAQFLTSGMVRTEETLSLLFGDVPHIREPRFREIDFGVFEMHSYEELKDRKDYQDWISGDNDANIPPEGESGNAMTNRVLEALEPLLRQEETTVVITHGGVIAAIMAHLFPKEGKSRYDWQPRPGCGYAIENGTYRPLP